MSEVDPQGSGAAAGQEHRSGMRRAWHATIGRLGSASRGGVVLILVGVAVLALTLSVFDPLAAIRRVRIEQGPSDSTLIVKQATFPIGAIDSAAAPTERFRPVGGVVVGADFVLVDAGAGALVRVTAGGAVQQVALVLPQGIGLVAPRFADIAVSSTGSLLLTDLANGRIWNYSPEGRPLGPFLSDAQRKSAGLTKPTGVASDAQGRVIVADVGDQSIKVFNKSGSMVLSFGGAGRSPGKLNYPTDVVVDLQGRMFVADSNNRRIQVFGSDGGFLFAFNQTDSSQGLVLPRSLAFDQKGRVHVVDSFAERVSIYTPDGTFVGSYGASGPDADRLRLPEGVAIAGSRVLVGDRGNGRLVEFKMQG